MIGNNYDYIQRHLIESKHNNNYITVDELIAREFSRLRPGTTILLPPHFNKWCNVTSHNKQVFVLSRIFTTKSSHWLVHVFSSKKSIYLRVLSNLEDIIKMDNTLQDKENSYVTHVHVVKQD